MKCWRSCCVSGRGEGERTAPNRRGPDKQKRKRALASFKQNAKTQKKRHENKLATAAEGTAHLDAFGTRGTNRGDPEDTGPGSVDAATTTAAEDDYTERRMASGTRLEPGPIATKYFWKQLKMTTATWR